MTRLHTADFFWDALAGALAAAQALPKAETILDRYVEVTGGKAAYEKHTHEKMTGTILIPGVGMTGNVTRYAMAPDKEYSVLQLGPLGKAESGFSSGVAWEKNAIRGATDQEWRREGTSDEGSALQCPAGLAQELSQGGDDRLRIRERRGDCYKVLATPPAGRPETQYFSIKSGLLLKTDATIQPSARWGKCRW